MFLKGVSHAKLKLLKQQPIPRTQENIRLNVGCEHYNDNEDVA